MLSNTRFLVLVKADLIATSDLALPALKPHTMPKIVLKVARYAKTILDQSLARIHKVPVAVPW
jgi:hypothetical protein